MLEFPAPRRVWFNAPRPTIVYVEASGPGNIGAVLFYDNSSMIRQTQHPAWFLEVGNIYEFDHEGAIFGMTAAMVCAPGRPVVLFVYNADAPSGLIRGNFDTRCERVLTSVFRREAGHFSPTVCVDQVRSRLNVDDPPSR